MSKFIKTLDEDLAKKLRMAGLICVGIESSTNEYVFINNGNLPFIYEDNINLTFSDILLF